MKQTNQQESDAYRAAVQAVRRLTEKQRVQLLAEFEDESLRLNPADLEIDTALSSFDLNTDLPELDMNLPDFVLSESKACPFCGKGNR